MRSLTVGLGKRSYNIMIEKGILARCGEQVAALCRDKTIKSPKKVAVVTDTNVARYGYLKTVCDALESQGYSVHYTILPAGEKTKSLDTLGLLCRRFAEEGLTRSDLVVALGGGVIGDITGFAASVYLRNIAFIQIPTTLLAQADSSVGGKVAADIPEGKNLVGLFYQPKLVLIDESTLETLSPRVFADGMGEVIKHGCIKDAVFFEQLKNRSISMEDILYTNCKIKAGVVEQDELDLGERMKLNFGHTIAHALETWYQYETYTHGEAVAMGMYTITKLSEAKGLTKKGTAEEIATVLKQYDLCPELPEVNHEEIIGHMGLDKKNIGGKLNCILLKEIGESFIHETTVDFFDEWKHTEQPKK